MAKKIAFLLVLILATILMVACAGDESEQTNDNDTAVETAVSATIEARDTSPASTEVPTAGPAKPASTENNAANAVVVNGVQMGVIDPQSQQQHPTNYWETGISGSNTVTVEFPDHAVVVVGGVSVNGHGGGYYAAYNASPVTLAVENGFISIIHERWAHDEFCFRVGQAKEYGWSHGTVLPLQEWQSCTTTTATVGSAQAAPSMEAAPAPAAQATGERRASGQNAFAAFEAGESVYGWKIELSDGRVCDGGECFLRSAPVNGIVISGVVNPWDGEVPQGTAVWVP